MAKRGRAVDLPLARRLSAPGRSLQELLEQISGVGRERGKSARVSVKWQQAVLRFDYVEAGSAPEARVVMEEANEGEKE